VIAMLGRRSAFLGFLSKHELVVRNQTFDIGLSSPCVGALSSYLDGKERE
jgi:hypothetical protein